MKSTQKILIVDDTQINIDIIKSILGKYNYELFETTEPKKTLQIAQEEKVDLILLDIIMPEIDGYEVCKLLKINEATKSIPIIFISIKDENIIKGFELGAVDYITKPFQANELYARVNTHLELRQYQEFLEQKVKEELIKNQEQQEMLFQQNKLASMGEVIENIAHQWRQPLSVINSAVLIIDDELVENKIDNSLITEKLDEIESMSIYMSKTIEYFREYCKPNNNSTKFKLQTALENLIKLSSAILDSIKVEIINHTKKDVYIRGVKNEFLQALLIIINNSKDALSLNNVLEPYVCIEVQIKDSNLILSISDNGGGIDDSIIDKIFEPYFTTKHKSQGTGLGLYLCRKIVHDKMKGRIYMTNIKDGVKFNIQFSLEEVSFE